MTAGIREYERLLSAWRQAETEVEALKAFQSNGGEHRLRVGTDNDNGVIPAIVDKMMHGNGYKAILGSAIKNAEFRSAQAKAAFIAGTTTDEGEKH